MKQVLSLSSAYRFLQFVVGTQRARQWYVKEVVKPKLGCRVIDLGCGPADYLDLLPQARYIGVDVNPRYIAHARRRFGNRGEFYVGNIYAAQSMSLPEADIVMANAVIHHVDDAEARALFDTAKRCLRPGGRLVTFDNYLRENQNPISRWLIRNDRGQHPRKKAEYVALAREFFDEIKVYERNSLYRIPYDLIMLECSNVSVVAAN